MTSVDGIIGEPFNAIIENLTINIATIYSAINSQTVAVGGLVGTAMNSTIKNCCIKNSKIEAIFGMDSRDWYQGVGGLCEVIQNSTIQNSFASIDIEYTNGKYSVDEIQIGGLAGYDVCTSTNLNSYSEGKIVCNTSTNTSATFIGG